MGKSKGKRFFSLAMMFVGFANPAMFGLKAGQGLLGGLYGASLGGSLWTATHQPKSTSGAAFDALTNATSSRDRIPLIYGTRKWGGYVSWHEVYDNKKQIHKDIIWCEGDISGMSDVRANDIKISSIDNASYTFKPGSIADEHPDNYLTVGSYRRTAWSRFHFKANDLVSGNPTVTAVIKGKLITDTRTSAYAYSENCSMCVRDYLISKRYGAGHFISTSDLDEDSFKEVADYCDALVTTRVPTTLSTVDAVNAKISELQQKLASSTNISSDETDKINDEITRLQLSLITIASQPVEYTLEVTPRYTMNIIIAEQKSHLEILQDMLAVFGGYLVFCNNKVSLRCERALNVSYDFDDDNIIQDTLVHTQYPIESSPNRYSVTFYDPANYYTGVKLVVEDLVSQKERGKVIPKEVDLTGCTSQSQALRLARMYRDKVALSQVVVTFSTATMAMHLEPGDVITLTKHIYPNGVDTILFDHIPFRILEISEETGIYTIKAEQYNASVYNDAIGAQIQVQNYVTVDNPAAAPPTVTNVIATEYNWLASSGYYINDIDLSFDPSAYLYSVTYLVSLSRDNGSTWRFISSISGTTYRIENLAVGDYLVGVQPINKYGVLGERATANISIVDMNISAPNDLQAFSVTYLNGKYIFSWTKPSSGSSITGYEIRKGSTWDSGQVIKRAVGEDTSYTESIAMLGTATFFCKPYNAGGYSSGVLSDLITIDVLPMVQTLYSQLNFEQLCTTSGTGTITNDFTCQSTDVTYESLSIKTYDEWSTMDILGTPQGAFILLSPVITLDALVKASVSITESWVCPPDTGNIYEISTSLDGINFGDFKLLGSGSLPMKSFQLRITLNGVRTPAILQQLGIDVVASQNTLPYPGLTIPVGGLELVFSQTFASPPSVIVSPNATALTPKKDASTTTSCKIYLLDSSGVDVGGTADVVIVGI